jgi:tRNA threonylcarbamoyladenosine biosynthesis protein TsaE
VSVSHPGIVESGPQNGRLEEPRNAPLQAAAGTPSPGAGSPPGGGTAAAGGRDALTVTWRSEADTQAFAAIRHCFIALHGDLGAGKTTFVRLLLRALGVQGRIKSPTYAVVEPHEAGGLAIWHFDFYRFTDPREWEDAGFRELFASPGLKVAEWPGHAAGALPIADLDMHIHPQDDETRHVHLHAGTAIGHALLQELAQ